VQLTREALGETAYDDCVAAGATMTFTDAVALALGGGRAKVPDSALSAGDGVRLTRREAEIARLVADGLSNREIAERLFLAPRTAEGHVQHALGKLGLTSRRQLAGWVAEQANRGSPHREEVRGYPDRAQSGPEGDNRPNGAQNSGL
jgi:non-specific serine/threonine protein kinase